LRGWWSLPGGAVETGENLEAAVQREVKEETGLDVSPVRVVELFERIMRDSGGQPEYHYVLVDFLCKVTGGELRAADDANRAAWISIKELEGLQLTAGTLPVIERAFAERTRMALGCSGVDHATI
jgi:8-oxo-dGTP diphosphatase